MVVSWDSALIYDFKQIGQFSVILRVVQTKFGRILNGPDILLDISVEFIFWQLHQKKLFRSMNFIALIKLSSTKVSNLGYIVL